MFTISNLGLTVTKRRPRPVTVVVVAGKPHLLPRHEWLDGRLLGSYRKNNLQVKKSDVEGEGVGMFVKVSMDGAPYLRKVDLKVYKTYSELLKGLEDLFKFTIDEYSEREGYNGSEYVPTYEDKDGDWMLVGDVPWEMFISTCKRLRIMKGGLCCV